MGGKGDVRTVGLGERKSRSLGQNQGQSLTRVQALILWLPG